MVIRKFPDQNLLTACIEVKVFGPELKTLLESMWETMKENAGIGLSANQVGLGWRMFVMEDQDNKYFVVNPKIVWRSAVPAMIKEGCLSAPGEFIILPERSSIVKVQFQDETGKYHTKIFKEVSAVCVQHEIDHLDGKAYLQSEFLPRSRRQQLARKWGLND